MHRPALLVISFFPAFEQARSGGELRLLGFYRALSAWHDVVLLTATHFGVAREEVWHTPRMREIRVPKDARWRAAHAALQAQGLDGDLFGLAFALAVSDPACPLRLEARRLAAGAEIVVHEFPYSEPIFADGSAPCEIYNAHNFEPGLLPAIMRGPGLHLALAKLLRLEENLLRRAAMVAAPSAEDVARLRLLHGVRAEKLAICPNGFVPELFASIAAARGARLPARRPLLLFAASAHPPNLDCLPFLLDLATELAECDILVAGGAAAGLPSALPANLRAEAGFDAARKQQLLAMADVFLNPVLSGSGTSLKAVEALAAGLPMVSTPQGARGLGLEDGVHAIIAPRAGFAAAIRALRDIPRRTRIAVAARALALRDFSWPRIAADFSARLAARPVQQAIPKLTLVLNDYPAPDCTSGGAARMRQVMARLEGDIVFLSFGPVLAFTLVRPNILHITVAKTPAQLADEAETNAGAAASANDIVAARHALGNPMLRDIAAHLARRADLAIFEHCYMAPLLDLLRLARPGLPVVYSAHNIEAVLKPRLLHGHARAGELAGIAADMEQRLCAAAALVACCTAEDAAYFRARRCRTILLPNAAAPQDPARLAQLRAKAARRMPRLGFLGSAHSPNIAAAHWIVDELAGKFPDLVFEIAGSVGGAIDRPRRRNVRLLGVLDEARKTATLAGWCLALNPLLHGGGSSLKLPDYLAHGVPALSTAEGARGFDLVGAGAGMIAPLEKFPAAIRRLLARPATLARMRGAALDFAAAELGWDKATQPYRRALRRITTSPPAAARRLLLVTPGYGEPPRNAEEAWLQHVLPELRPAFARIDLATIGAEGPAQHIAPWFDTVHVFPPDPTPADLPARAHALERAWLEEEPALLAPRLAALDQAAPHLCGGFHELEADASGRLFRWTAPGFALLLPPRTRYLSLIGQAPRPQILRARLEVSQGDAVAATFRHGLAGEFTCTLALPLLENTGPLLLRCAVEDEADANAARPRGIKLCAATAIMPDGGTRAVQLAENGEELCCAGDFPAWVAALLHRARHRPPAMEENFAALHAPVSQALQDWLAGNAAGYDAVLVQGGNAGLLPRSLATLRRLRQPPRIATLSHFRADDRRCYWQGNFRAFAAADINLVFSAEAASLLATHGNFAVLPGDAIDPAEHATPQAKADFRALRGRAATPFFLVLGRKLPELGYGAILAAHAALRQAGQDIDLVLIGPDEDGVPLAAPGVQFLGPLTPHLVRAALEACLGLIAMNRSASFGGVLCEAWLAGKPVIANARCAAFRDLVTPARGILAQDPAELAAAMHRLAADAALRASLGAAGQAFVTSAITWPAIARGLAAELAGNLQSR